MYGEYDRKNTVKIENFDGGLNTKASPVQLELNQSPDCQNVIFDDFGAVGTNNGFSQVNTFPIASAVMDGLHTYTNNSGTAKLMGVCNGTFHYLSGTTFATIPSGESIYTAGVDVQMHTYNNVVYACNGYANNYKYNGTEFTRMGVDAPSQTAAAATNATAGNLTGSYVWVYTAENSYLVESDYGGATATFTAVGESVTVSNIPTAPASHGINQWYLYRNTAGAEGVYYRVTAITNGTTSFVDNIADSSISTAAPTDNAEPRKVKYMVNHQGRLFMAGEVANPSYLWYSESNTPEKVPSTNFVRVGDGDGMIITGLAVNSNSIAITKSDSNGHSAIYLLYTSDSTGLSEPYNWYLIKSDAAYGGESHKALVNYSNVLAFLNRDGVFAFVGKDVIIAPSETNTSTLRMDAISFDIEPDIQAFSKSLLSGAAAINYKNKLWFAVPSTSSSTENDKIYQFDYVRASKRDRITGAWVPFSGHSINNFAIYNDELYGGSSTANGIVYKLDDTANYNGSAINSYYFTAPIAGDKKIENWIKLWRYVYLLVECSGDWNMIVNYIVDFSEDGGTETEVNLGPEDEGTALWDSAVWDSAVWGGDGFARKRVRIDLQNAIGQYIQLKFSTNDISRYWKVHKAEFYYKLRGARD